MSQLIKDISAHLAKQRKQSLRYEAAGLSSCAYRGYDGSMCAVGCLIPDELYDKEIEGLGSEMVLDYHPNIKGYLREKYNITSGVHTTAEFYAALFHAQTFHDGNAYNDVIAEHRDQSDEALAQAIEKEILRRLE